MKKIPKNKILGVKLDDLDWELVLQLEQETRLSKSNLIRLLLRAAYQHGPPSVSLMDKK